MKVAADFRWTPAGLGLLAGLAGLVVAGPVGFVVALVGGVVAARRAELVVLTAASALVITAVFTVLEQPLTEDRIPAFPSGHPIAELFGKIAAVLLLAGLVGLTARRGGEQARELPAREPDAVPARRPISTIIALLAAGLLGAFVLWQFGDQRWHAAAPLVAILVIVMGGWLLHTRPIQSPFGR